MCARLQTLATMEGANESARRAVNNILSISGSDAEECKIWNLHEPELLAGPIQVL